MAANNDNTSTLKSYVDSATGAAQNLLGSLTGSTADQNKGEAKQDKAQLEHDASHATAKVPGFTATAGGVTKDDPDRAGGSWNQTVGSAKETVGGLVGSENLKQQGREQNLEGQQQEAKGQLNDYTSGIGNRVQGTIGGAVAGLTGDKAGQAHYEGLHDTGKTQQRGAEHDIQKQAEARQQRDLLQGYVGTPSLDWESGSGDVELFSTAPYFHLGKVYIWSHVSAVAQIGDGKVGIRLEKTLIIASNPITAASSRKEFINVFWQRQVANRTSTSNSTSRHAVPPSPRSSRLILSRSLTARQPLIMELTPRPLPTAVRNAGFQVLGSSPSRRVFYRQKCQSARGFLPFLSPVGGLCPRYAAQWIRTNPPNEAPKMRATMMGATVGHKLSPSVIGPSLTLDFPVPTV
ncbi:hypothetical protein Landi51_03311 [Colletotrichum acutatum]